MDRTQLSPQRLSETRRDNIGRRVIFCEGKTEKYYFDYFAKIIKKNNQKFNNYGKYLVFDCNEPPDIQSVISKSTEYELLVSNYLFEIWLLMHYEDVDNKISKKEIYQRLSSHLHSTYFKGHKDKTREIIQNGNIEKAIDNAKNLEKRYKSEEKNIFTNIKDMNPFTSVYKLIEQFMVGIS